MSVKNRGRKKHHFGRRKRGRTEKKFEFASAESTLLIELKSRKRDYKRISLDTPNNFVF